MGRSLFYIVSDVLQCKIFTMQKHMSRSFRAQKVEIFKGHEHNISYHSLPLIQVVLPVLVLLFLRRSHQHQVCLLVLSFLVVHLGRPVLCLLCLLYHLVGHLQVLEVHLDRVLPLVRWFRPCHQYLRIVNQLLEFVKKNVSVYL